MSESRPQPDVERPLPVAVPLPESVPAAAGASRGPAGGNEGRRGEKKREADEPPRRQDPLVTVLLEYSPPWLVSMVFHMLVLIIMGLVIFSQAARAPVRLEAEAAAPEQHDEPMATDAPVGLPDGSPEGEGEILAPPDLKVVVDPLAGPGKVAIRLGGHAVVGDIETPGVAWSLRGSNWGAPQARARLGASPDTQAAVARGLEWLARNQQRDGSWSLAGPYSDGVSFHDENQPAATAMALLAFQGDGNTHTDGKYKKNVAKAWNWLLKQQDNTGSFFQVGNYTHRFYTHGMCSIAICELYGMTRDSRYRAPAQMAIDYCLKTQSREGGWRYNPNSESDVSVTGWIVMALQSARMAGLKVPAENLYKVEKFLDSAASPNGPGYRYQATDLESVRASMTAEALLMREYLGWKHDDPRLVAGIDWLTSPANLIDYKHNRNVYYWYYATQAAFHMGGAPWKRWNAVMRKVMPAQQIPRGREGGSWNPRGSGDEEDDQFAGSGGRLYVTCLSIYMLEVYYRHMPLYSGVYSHALPPPKPADAKEKKGAVE
jgi:hypothetical protein